NRHGVHVPDDVSVVGFDDLEMSEHFIPPLTTIRQPRAAIGKAAATLLLAVMESERKGGSAMGNESRILPVELIVRGSTAALTPAQA
ncbi:MAG TPA: substrate-binding domain-containing protein, partial [Mesorhizobium sp.]